MYSYNITHRLNAESKEWKCSSIIQRNYDTRHPSLRPAFKWLGLVPPGAKVQTELVVHNDTHQHVRYELIRLTLVTYTKLH